MLAKAQTLSADLVFIDLEDAVAPQLKNDATRRNVVEALLGGWVSPTRVVRINAVGTSWWLDDLQVVVADARDSLHCVMVPKVESSAQLHVVSEVLAYLERKHGIDRPIGLEVQIESPLGLVGVEEIATASDRIETLIFGPGDYAAAAGMPQLTVGAVDPTYPGDQWQYQLSRIVTAARAFGLQAIDGPYAAIHDLAGFAEVARRSRALGFDGKWALHPSQIETCNAVYAPTDEDVARATRILDAYRAAVEIDGVGAAVLEAEMIDEASRKMAESVVARARAARALGSTE
jgi:citrate lyase subunit beta/citryl-CoA lyase